MLQSTSTPGRIDPYSTPIGYLDPGQLILGVLDPLSPSVLGWLDPFLNKLASKDHMHIFQWQAENTQTIDIAMYIPTSNLYALLHEC